MANTFPKKVIRLADIPDGISENEWKREFFFRIAKDEFGNHVKCQYDHGIRFAAAGQACLGKPSSTAICQTITASMIERQHGVFGMTEKIRMDGTAELLLTLTFRNQIRRISTIRKKCFASIPLTACIGI